MPKHTKRIDVPPEVATGSNGEAAWIELNTRVKNKHRNAFMKVVTKAALVNQIDEKNKNPEYQKKAMALVAQFDGVMKGQYDALAAFVVGWNWTGDNGLPLPKPESGKVFEDELYDYQTDWIEKQIQTLERFRATEGNAPSTTPS
jgi:hypothetical protein